MKDEERARALERLMDEHGDAVKRLCAVQLGDRQQAEEAAQDTFVKAWRGMERFRGECGEKTWLMRIAINTCRDYQRTAWFRHRLRRVPLDSLPEQAQEPDWLAGEVTAAVRALPGRLRTAAFLRYYQGMTLGETARAMAVSESTVKRLMQRANALLRRQLKGWWDDE